MLLYVLVACCDCSVEPAPTQWQAPGVRLDWGDADVSINGDTLGGQGHGEDVVLTMRWAIDGEGPARWWRQGWQSWSWSGVVDVGDDEPVIGGDGDTYSVLEESAQTSWEAALLGRPGGHALHVGALSAKHTKVWFGITPETLTIHWEDPGDEELDPVRISAGDDPVALWEGWADQIEGRPSHEVPYGWSDWSTYFGTATEDDILRNADEAAAMGLELVQVDDGWERAWGDWQANDAFPSGVDGLAAAITAKGLTPGLWMAPLLVDRSTDVYLEHGDWWVRDAEGVELTDGACDCATLDVTHPDAAAWLYDQVHARVVEGWRYLKLDFLYAGAREGVRVEDVNGVEAYAIATGILREAAGDAWILACGAPMLPSVGFADSYRTGADINFSAFPDADRAFLRWQARNTAARGWADGRWWRNDPDSLLLATDSSAAIVAQAVSGGSWLYGEELPVDLTGVDLRGVAFRPRDPLDFVGGVDGSPVLERASPDDTVPTAWDGDDGTVALLNLDDTEIQVDGPGGTERLTGATAEPGPRTLAPGTGEIWGP